jgi:hypothetical protein
MGRFPLQDHHFQVPEVNEFAIARISLRMRVGSRRTFRMLSPGISEWVERLRLKRALKADARAAALGEAVLGSQQWSLLRTYGKCMSGPPFGGLYVSGLPAREVEHLLKVLANGGTVPIHLMHRHRSGDHERSFLRLGSGAALVMVYPDRD